MRITIRLTIAFLLVLFAISAIAQSDAPRNGACFFRDTGFRGAHFCVQAGESLENLPSGFNDGIRSLRVYGNAQVTAFNDARFANASTIFNSDVPDLNQVRMANDASRNWAERISSLQVTSMYGRNQGWNYNWGNQRAGGNSGACFFEQPNFRGRSFCVDRGEMLANLPPGFNDRIQSIRVLGGAEVQMFSDNNFNGAAARTRQDVADLRGWRIPDDSSRNWGGRISSLRVGAPSRGRWDNYGGYRDDDGDGRDDRWENRGNGRLIGCNSRPGDDRRFCNASGFVRDAAMINSTGTCRKDSTWGIENGRLWVSNGCSADFQVQR